MNSLEISVNKHKKRGSSSSRKFVKSEALKMDEIMTRNKLKKFREIETAENVNSSKDQQK